VAALDALSRAGCELRLKELKKTTDSLFLLCRLLTTIDQEDADMQALGERIERVTIAVSSSEELEVTRIPEKLPDLPEFT
jgi:hypothetical protein